MFKAHLMQHYTVGEETIIDPLPWMETAEFTLDKMYTEIRMLQTEPNQPNKPVAMHDIFWCSDEVQRPHNVLIQGNPGIGKSTFCRKLVYDWAKGNIPESIKFPCFEMLLKLNCCEMEDGSIWDAIHKQLVPEEFDEEERGVLFEYIKSNQKKICLIFDGYDEIPETETGHQILSDVKKVISKKSLSLCSLLLTSRQSKAQEIVKHFQRFFEIKGFDRSDAEKYIRKFYNSESVLTNELISFIHINRFAAELVSNPLNTTLLCIVFKENKERIINKKGFTISELYAEIVRCVTKRYCSKANIEVDDDTIMDEFRPQHLALGKMAFDGLQQDQVRFTVKQMPEEGLHKLGFLVREKSFSATRPEKRYSFAHKSIQDYFAALYLAERLKEGESSDVFALTTANLYATYWYDVPGLVGKANASKAVERITSRLPQDVACPPIVLLLLLELLSESQGEEGYQKTLDGVYSQMPALVRYIQYSTFIPLHSRIKALEGLCCLLTRTDPVHADNSQPIVPQPYNHLRFLELHGLQVNDVALHFGDAMATNTSVDQLIIDKSVLGNQDAHAIAKVIRRNKTLSSFRLNLGNCSEEATLEILTALLENSTLKYFLIAGDNIGDQCAIALAKVLDKNILTTLFVISEKIGKSGAVAIAKGLANNRSLQELRLERFPNLSQAAADFANALVKNKTLRQLFLSSCNVDDSAAKKIAEGVSKNTSLIEIGITNSFLIRRDKNVCEEVEPPSSSNPNAGVSISLNTINKDGTMGDIEKKTRFGDEGACSLAVSSAKSIAILNLSFNAIQTNGAIAIGRILTHHCVLEVLNISANLIGDDGAKVIAEGLKGNSTLKELNIAQNAISWEGISYVARALTENNSLLFLEVSQNNIGGDPENRGAKAIKTMLTKNTALKNIAVRDVTIGDTEASLIAEGLTQNKGIQIFDISFNNIGDTVMCDIADAATVCSTLEALEIVGINLGEKSAQAVVRACKTSKTMRKISHSCEAIRKRCGIQEVFQTIDVQQTINQELHMTKAGMVVTKQSGTLTYQPIYN